MCCMSHLAIGCSTSCLPHRDSVVKSFWWHLSWWRLDHLVSLRWHLFSQRSGHRFFLVCLNVVLAIFSLYNLQTNSTCPPCWTCVGWISSQWDSPLFAKYCVFYKNFCFLQIQIVKRKKWNKHCKHSSFATAAQESAQKKGTQMGDWEND